MAAEGNSATRSEAMGMARGAREVIMLMIVRAVPHVTRAAMARTASCTSSGEASFA